MLPIMEFEKRFREILERLDAMAGESGDEDLEELGAEFEDAIFMLSEIDPKSADAAEEFADAMDEFDALGEDCARFDGAREVADRIRMLAEMARANL